MFKAQLVFTYEISIRLGPQENRLRVRLGEVGKESRKAKIESGKEKDGEREKKGKRGKVS